MNLCKFDNKKVLLETIYGDTFEGISSSNSIDYNEHEYGVSEESIQMSHIMIYESQIKRIKIIKEFSCPYGELEEAVLEDGLDMVDEVFESEEDVSIYRLLSCIKDKINNCKDIKELIKLLDYLIKYNENNEIIDLAKNIKNMII